MKNLVMRCAILVVCAIPLVLAAGAGTAGADDEPLITVHDVPGPHSLIDSLLPEDPLELEMEVHCHELPTGNICTTGSGICITGVGTNYFGIRLCSAIGTD